MADLLTLNCPTCGGQLQVTNDVDRFVCAHCGNAHIVDPGVRVESLAAEVSALRVESNIQRLQNELQGLEQQRNRLDSEVKTYRQNAQSEVVIYRLAGIGLFVLAFNFLGTVSFELSLHRYGIVFLAICVEIALVAIGFKILRQKARLYTDPLDDVIKGIADMERQIVQKQRELETLQRRIGSLPVRADDSVNNDTQHALRTTTA